MIINANALHIPLADRSVQCIVTSPPYWGLRNYGISGQLGLERTPEEYIANMVAVFRECWRVLRNDGTLWLNCGDSYNSNASNQQYKTSIHGSEAGMGRYDKRVDTLKSKDLIGIPWRLAFALQADGWYLRSDIIWSKPNPMPESVTDRPTKSHEYLFLLAKQERYYYDAEAIREEGQAEWEIDSDWRNQRINASGGVLSGGNGNGTGKHSGRNRRTVWTIPTAPYKGAHFATFPPTLVEPCIKAGTSERGACPKCGKGWRRVVEKHRTFESGSGKSGNLPNGKNGKGLQGGGETVDIRRGPVVHNNTINWIPSCTCDAGDPIPCLVFDPFVGSGTTVKVAYDLGRRGVGLDLSLDYLDEQARKRIHNGHIARLF